jgi:putative sigma-54 modulation protein
MLMQIIVQGHGTNVTAPMRDYAHKKIGKLEQYFHNIQKCEVVLDARSIDDQNLRQVAEVTLWAAGKKVIRATEAAQDMYAAIDLVFEELERQVRKHKDKKVKETRRREKQQKQDDRNAAGFVPEEGGISIVDVRRFASKPMSVEEAKEEIKALDQDFLLFRNPESNSINLAFRKYDGVHVLEPEENEVKTFSPDDAVNEIRARGMDFLMFQNKETNNINVLYRRHSGNYGLIEPKY